MLTKLVEIATTTYPNLISSLRKVQADEENLIQKNFGVALWCSWRLESWEV